MKSLIAVSAVIAVMSAAPAFATSTASAMLSNFNITLTSIDPSGESIPSLTFYNKNSVIFSYLIDSYDNQPNPGFGLYSNTEPGVAPKSASFSSPTNNAQASSSITGDFFSDAILQTIGTSQGNEGFFSTGLNSTSYFTLGAFTQATLTAKYQTKETITVGGVGQGPFHPNESARTSVGILVNLPNFLNLPTLDIQKSDIRDTNTVSLYGIPVSLSDASMLSIVLSNTSENVISGYEFYASINASGYSFAPITDSPSPVPLPTTMPLLLSSLGLIGFAARRKQK